MRGRNEYCVYILVHDFKSYYSKYSTVVCEVGIFTHGSFLFFNIRNIDFMKMQIVLLFCIRGNDIYMIQRTSQMSAMEIMNEGLRRVEENTINKLVIMHSEIWKIWEVLSLVPIRAMTGLGANGDIRPKNWFQKVSIFGPLYLSQKWWRYCNGVQPHLCLASLQ
jgi:hypothetical protein